MDSMLQVQAIFARTLTQVLRFGVVLAIAVLSASCAGKATPARPTTAELLNTPSPSPTPVPGQIYREAGVSSWYGKDFHGRKTANGETYDMYGISAAHRTLPLGTYIRVTNLDNYKSIKVKVNDRGPFAKSRILDLSYGAAKELGFVAQGTAKVRIETLEEIRDSTPSYTVQAGAFIEEENARMLKQRLSKKYDTVYIVPFESNTGKFFRVRVGSYSTEEKAERVASSIMLEGVEPIVLRKD
jgi:rare lipoprotein A